MNPAGFQAALSDASRLKQIWGYEAGGSPTAPGTWRFFRTDVTPGLPNDLALIEPGRAYWVQLSQPADLVLTGPAWSGAVALSPGWNLVGFPGIDLAEDEAQDFASVFGGHLGSIQQVWTHENDSKRFVGYDLTAIPALRELNQVKPGMGYWIYATAPLSIQPGPYVAIPGDADASPLEPEVDFVPAQFPGLPNAAEYSGSHIRKVRPGSEDAPLDLNGNGIIDSPFTQNTLKFDVGVDRKVITVGNQGTGLANWVLSNSVPWLFTASPDENTYPGNVGRPKTASGVVSAERDTVTLYADTKGLQPGIQTGQVTIYVGNLVKTITVLLDVPTSNGDWKGYATTQSVNGRAIGIGAVDMGINLFMEEGSSSNFRAVLNRDTSLLFPRDVFMNGVFYTGNSFSLTTNFEMPTGDRNAPPFDTFSQPSNYNSLTGAAKARADFDANNDHKLDVSNPFPFPVRRQITLLGERKTPDRMEGSYIESITGILPASQPIFIQGTFYLDRQTFAPTKRSIFNEKTNNSPILIGSTGGVLYRDTSLNVGSSVSIQGVKLTLNLTFPDPTKLTITLYGPNSQSVVIHQGGSTLPTSLELSQFNGLLGNGPWKMRVAWLPTAERGYFNSWNLDIQGLATYTVTGKIVGNLGSGNVPLDKVHLVLSGSNIIKQADTAPFTIPTTTISGSTIATVPSTSALYAGMPITGNPAIPGATTVSNVVDATSFTLSAAATATTSAATTFGEAGVFKFTGLTENNYTLALSRPGFDSRLISFFLNNANLYIGHGGGSGVASTDSATLTADPVQLAPTNVTTPELRVGPFIGQEPLFTGFTALVPLASLNALGTIQSATWNFGDGGGPVTDSASTSDEIALTTANHLYQRAGVYTASLLLDGSLSDITITSPPIHVQRMVPDPNMPLTGNGQPATQCIVAGFVGSFAAPLSNVGNPLQIAESGTLTQTIRQRQANGTYSSVVLIGIAKGVVYQESKRDAGGFDIDRPPAIVSPLLTDFHPAAEDSDLTGQLYLTGDGSPGLPIELRTYGQLTPAEKQIFDEDNTPNSFATYTPPQVGGVNVADRFRVFTTLGGAVFATEPNKVGDYLLQPGRVER
jgi:subtilisin-like proprotein convertase family protein